MDIEVFTQDSQSSADKMFEGCKCEDLVVEGYWAQGMYHGGFISYWLYNKGDTWILESLESNRELDGLTQEDIDEGSLSDDQIEALADMTLEEAQAERWECVVAVGKNTDPSWSPARVAALLYGSLDGAAHKLVSEREDDYGLLSDEAFEATD